MNQFPLQPQDLPKLFELTERPRERQPLGNPIDWNESDLDALASISSADLKQAEALWQQDAPPALRDLLGADVIEQGQS
jgi:hypothetical protein